jgi:hypothetical protein
VIDLLTSDAALFVLSTVGIVATAASILRDTRAQKASVATEKVRIGPEL